MDFANHALALKTGAGQDDYLPLAQDYDWPLLDHRARTWIASLALDFGRVVFVGVAGRLFMSYSLPLLPEEANAL